jgi:hypothetical protein
MHQFKSGRSGNRKRLKINRTLAASSSFTTRLRLLLRVELPLPPEHGALPGLYSKSGDELPRDCVHRQFVESRTRSRLDRESRLGRIVMASVGQASQHLDRTELALTARDSARRNGFAPVWTLALRRDIPRGRRARSLLRPVARGVEAVRRQRGFLRL